MAQAFDISITDLTGKSLTTLFQYTEPEVVIPINGMRTARVTLNIYNPKCQFVKSYAALLKIRFYGIPVFWGIIKNPLWGGNQNTVEVRAVDPSIKMLMNFIRDGDYVHDSGYSLDGDTGMWDIIDAARIGSSWDGHTPPIPDLGIGQGFTDFGSIEGTVVKKVDRGQQVQSEVDDFAASAIGPDWELQPVDEQYNPNGTNLHAPNGTRNFVEMNVYSRQGDPDKWQSLRFHHGWGRNNAEDATLEEGDVINYAVAVGGKDNKTREIARNVTSWEQFGIYAEWESGGSTASEGSLANVQNVLRARAKLPLLTNSYPPGTFTVIPKIETPDARFSYRYMRDFKIGDSIQVVSKKGFQQFNEIGRITEVILTRDEASGKPRQAVTAVPRNTIDEDEIVVIDD